MNQSPQQPFQPQQPQVPSQAQSRSQQASQPSQDNYLPSDYEPEKSRVAPGMYKPMPEQTVFEWTAASRPFKKRDRQFFTTVAVIALLVSLILFFAGQFLPIAVVISVAFLVYVLSVIPPHDIKHKITTYGIHIEEQLYYWEYMGRYWFEEKYDKPLLKVEVAQFPGRITLVIDKKDKTAIDEILSEVLLKEKPELTTFEKSAEWLQKKLPLEGIN